MKRLIPILFFLSTPAWSAISLIQKVHPTTGGSCITTITANSVGDLIAVACEGDTGEATSVTDNATGGTNSYTEVTTARGGMSSPFAHINIYYSQAAHAGATAVTCNMSAGGCFGTAVYTYSGALASGNPVDTSSGSVQQTGSSNVDVGAPVTTTNAGDVIFTYIAPANSVTAVASPYTDFIENTTNGDASADYIPGSTVSASKASWTDSSSAGLFGTAVAAFLPASGGGGTPSNFTIYNNGLTISSNLTTSGNAGSLVTK